MESRQLGHSGLAVSALGFGTMTFGGQGAFAAMGAVDVPQARRLVDLCLDAGVNLFDSADAYSNGAAEEILGQALRGRRDEVVLATKAYARTGPGANDVGSSRAHLVWACEASLRRLGTEYIDLYQLHGFDVLTPLEETLSALDDLVRRGLVRYVGCSNFSAWHLMKALAVSERRELERFVSVQAYYSLVARELEFELVPLALDQGVGVIVWSPLAGGYLSAKAEPGRRASVGTPGTIDEVRGQAILGALRDLAGARGVSPAQVALNYLLAKRGVTSVLIGARSEEQLRDNLGAATWRLAPEEVARLDDLSAPALIYPYWHQRQYGAERNPGGGIV